MIFLTLALLVDLVALVAAQPTLTNHSMGYGPFGNASMTPNGTVCGECNIFFFPYLRVWNESKSADGSHDNFTIATARVTIYEDTGVTTTNLVKVNTTATKVPCTGPRGQQICPLYTSSGPHVVSTYTLSAGPHGINITETITSPTALIWWGAYSLQGAYPTTNANGSTICNSTTKLNGTGLVAAQFTSVTTYPYSDMPAAYTGTVANPALSFGDIPFPTASAANFLAQFHDQNAFSYCTPLRYSGSPGYASPVLALTQTQTIISRQAEASPTPTTTTIVPATTAQRSSIATPTSSAAPLSPPLTTHTTSVLQILTQNLATSPVLSSSAIVYPSLKSSSVSSVAVEAPTVPSSAPNSPETSLAVSAVVSDTTPLTSESTTVLTTVTKITVVGGTVIRGSTIDGTTLVEATVVEESIGPTGGGSTAVSTRITEVIGGTVIGGSTIGGTTLTEVTVVKEPIGSTGSQSTTVSTTVTEVTVVGGTVIGGSTIGGTTLTEATVIEPSIGSTTVPTTVTEVTVIGGKIIGGSTIGGTTLTEVTVIGESSESASFTQSSTNSVPIESIVPASGGSSNYESIRPAIYVAICGLITILVL